ncbi:tyrosine-type recombinase/integrase [Rhodococcus opacus]|uniref:tyrosine-type recombinase/integrase n=1 Tax=Rhodococcus opacus TaxID=37919 RepID=UPI00155A3DA8|nr:site-specific integrase [Rhodococcus opacus]
MASGIDANPALVHDLICTDDDRPDSEQRVELISAIYGLITLRIVFPSYDFLAHRGAQSLYIACRRMYRPDLFAKLKAQADHLAISSVHHREVAIAALAKIVVRTGRDLDQLTAEDLFAYRAWFKKRRNTTAGGLSLAWRLLHGIGDLGQYATLEEAARQGQRTPAQLVDFYGVQAPTVRRVLIRYLEERQPGLDYTTMINLSQTLVLQFWCEIEQHHPGLDTLHLPEEIVAAWKERLLTTPTHLGAPRAEDFYFTVVGTVRAFYRDLQDWAQQDPAWAEWAYPNPIRKSDIAGWTKARQTRNAATHQRIRERLPHLHTLVESAEHHRDDQAALLSSALTTPVDETFEHGGRGYRRVLSSNYRRPDNKRRPPELIEDLATGEIIDVGRNERNTFWAWAIIEVLRQTGIRIEELLELTHLGLVAYKLPKSGEIVPMLQIAPSKANEERLLLVSPELASVLATIISRLRNENGGHVPLTERYDPNEKMTGPPLPHLFQRRSGWGWKVFTHSLLRGLLNETLARTGLTDASGQPLHYTPHDFRRLWATDAVNHGLPVHIAAKILGHKNINTTQGYTAVFDEHLIRSYRSFLDTRRALRPESEYREPTDEEWREFQQHFEIRKLELGTCGRPYSSPCQHEHACIRCPSLRVDPRSRNRLIEITENLRDRITEARHNGWTGEVVGLKVSLDAAASKLASLDRMQKHSTGENGSVQLGLPIIMTDGHEPA